MWPALIGAGASLLGGLMNSNAQDKANELNQQNQMRQEQLQREFAQSGIQWKVADAKAAGIHPLYALGANTVSYAPNVVGATPNTSLGSAVASSGQDISRALEATRTSKDSNSAFTKTAQELALQKSGLENQLLITQIAKMRGQLGPAMPALDDNNPIEGQAATRQLKGTLMGPFSIRTEKREATQDDVSKEYGDEGLPQIPGQLRFVRDVARAGYSRAKQWYRDTQPIHDRNVRKFYNPGPMTDYSSYLYN